MKYKAKIYVPPIGFNKNCDIFARQRWDKSGIIIVLTANIQRAYHFPYIIHYETYIHKILVGFPFLLPLSPIISMVSNPIFYDVNWSWKVPMLFFYVLIYLLSFIALLVSWIILLINMQWWKFLISLLASVLIISVLTLLFKLNTWQKASRILPLSCRRWASPWCWLATWEWVPTTSYLPTGLMLSEDVTERLKVCSKLIWMVNWMILRSPVIIMTATTTKSNQCM